MAPNRKNVSNLLSTLSSSDLASLQQSVQPKYLPLTHPQEESKHLEQEQQQESAPVVAKQPQTTSVSYWDWPTEDIKDEEEPAVVDLFSASRIEVNLIKSAAAQAEAESNTVADHDDYWAEASEQDVQEEKEVIRAPQHLTDASYWEWSSDEKEATIRSVLADEQARVQTSIESIERFETSNSRPTTSTKQVHSQKESNDSYWQWNSTKVASHVDDASHPNASYWDWEATPTAKPASMVQSIMEYEAARELLKVSTIVQQLQQTTVSSCGATKASSDDYWNFSEQYGDEYWQEQRQASAVTTGYWDW